MKFCEIIQGCSPEDIPQQVLLSDRPLVLKGLVSQWPIVKAAQKSAKDAYDYIRQFYNGELVNAAIAEGVNDGAIFYNADMSGFNYRRVKTRLDEVLNGILACEQTEMAPLYYVDSTPVDYCIPGFCNENDLKLGSLSPRVALWVGNKTVVSAHYDIPDNIACVVAGRRRFTLFPPEQLPNLYVGPLDFNPAGQAISLVDVRNPDFKKFPKFREALQSAQVAELELGDALFIPSMWWHHVEGLEKVNALVNYWWNSSPAYLGSPLDAFTHAIMSLRALPEDERKAWKNIFDYYIFDHKLENFSHIPEDRLGVLGEIDESAVRRMRALLLNRLNR